MKVTKTSCKDFNCNIFTFFDSVKNLKYKYKVFDLPKLTKDPRYVTNGPIALSLATFICMNAWLPPTIGQHLELSILRITISSVDKRQNIQLKPVIKNDTDLGFQPSTSAAFNHPVVSSDSSQLLVVLAPSTASLASAVKSFIVHTFNTISNHCSQGTLPVNSGQQGTYCAHMVC
jgi:hypothetical protein